MKSIIATYPDDHSLPRGINTMYWASESHIFNESKFGTGVGGQNVSKTEPGLHQDVTHRLQPVGD